MNFSGVIGVVTEPDAGDVLLGVRLEHVDRGEHAEFGVLTEAQGADDGPLDRVRRRDQARHGVGLELHVRVDPQQPFGLRVLVEELQRELVAGVGHVRAGVHPEDVREVSFGTEVPSHREAQGVVEEHRHVAG